jgi:predicted acyltransferase
MSSSVAAVSPVEIARAEAEPRWSLLKRIAFRFAFLYLMLYMFCNVGGEGAASDRDCG